MFSESYALNSLTMNGSSETIGTLSLGTNAINVSYNHIDGGFKHIDLTKQNIQVAMNAKIRLLSGAISTLANKLLMVF